jgi:hypothetical protein
MCVPDAPPPVDMNDPTIRKTVTALADRNFDPAAFAKASAQGYKDSGIIESWIVALLRGAIRLLAPLIEEAASLLDDVLAILAEVFQAAQGQNATGFYRLAGAMITDLTGIEADGEKLARDFASGGRQKAMRSLGGSIFDTLAAEFANLPQSSVNGVFQTPKGAGAANLPDITISPAQGVAGGRAFLGYAAGFAIREGNTDMLASYLPHGIGEMFKDFAEDFAKNLGIGRMARLVWKPLVSTLVATPMQQAMNQQYRPTLFDVGQAYRAWVSGEYSPDDLFAELALHGWSQKRGAALQWQHLHGPDAATIRTLGATGRMSDADVSLWHRRAGQTDEVTGLMRQAADVAPARDACLGAARHFAQAYLTGHITRVQFEGALNSVRHDLHGSPLLSDGEVETLLTLPEISAGAPRRHLSVAQLMRTYDDGLITLQEFSDAVTAIGYSPDDVRILEQELLVSAKRAADRNQKAAHAILAGRFAKLTVAQMETAFAQGLMLEPDVRTELYTRGYPQASIDTLVAEFRAKAQKQPSQPPQA